MIVKSTQQRTVKIMVRHSSTAKKQATVEKTFPPDFYLRFAQKVLWVRGGDNPPLTPPRRGRQETGNRINGEFRGVSRIFYPSIFLQLFS